MQRAQLSVGTAASRATGAHAADAHAHARRPLPRLPQLCARREARGPPRATQLALAINTCECVASLVLLTACAWLPRCRQPQLRGHRALDIPATTSRRDVDTTVTRIRPQSPPRSPAWPRRREACDCEACACEPGAVVLEAAAPSARTARPAHHRVQRRRLRPDHPCHDRHNKHDRGIVEE